MALLRSACHRRAAPGRLSPLTARFGDQVSVVARGREEADTPLRVEPARNRPSLRKELDLILNAQCYSNGPGYSVKCLMTARLNRC